MQLAVRLADFVRLLGLVDLVDDEADDRFLDLRTRSVLGQFGFDLILDAFGYLCRLQRVVEHQQRVVISVRGAVAAAGVLGEVRRLRRQRDGAEAFAGGGQIFGRGKRRDRLDARLRVDVVHDVARQRPPLGHRAVLDLDAFGVCFVQKQRDLAAVQKAQEIVDRLAVEVGISRRVVRVVDDDRRVFAEQVPQATAVVEQCERRLDAQQFVDQTVVSQTAVGVVLDLDVERIDVETVVGQQVLVLPCLHGVIDDIGLRPAVRVEQQVADDHLYGVRHRGLVQIAQSRQEVLDDLLVVVAQREVLVADAQIDQELLEASLVIGVAARLGDVLLIFFEEQIDTEILVEMVLQRPFVATRDDVQNQPAGIADLAAEVIERATAQIVAERLDLMPSAALEDRDHVDQLVAGVEIVLHPALELVDQLLSLNLLVFLLVAVFQKENEVAQLFERVFVLHNLSRERVELEQRDALLDVGVRPGLLEQQRFDFAAVLLDLHFELFAEFLQVARVDVLENQPQIQLRVGRRAELFRMDFV